MDQPSDSLSFDELKDRLHDPQLLVVDVLPRASYREGHIPGALSLPLEDLPQEAPGLLPDRDQEIGVYCSGPT